MREVVRNGACDHGSHDAYGANDNSDDGMMMMSQETLVRMHTWDLPALCPKSST